MAKHSYQGVDSQSIKSSHAFNPNVCDAEAQGCMDLWVPVQPGLHKQTLSQKTKKKKKYKINVYMTFNIKTVDGIFIHSLEITTKIYISQKHRSK